MIAYKVLVADHLGQLWSTNYRRNESGLHQEYFLDRTNVPAFDYPMFAFEDIQSARDFAKKFSREKIFKVSGRKSRIRPVYMAEIWTNNFEHFHTKSVKEMKNSDKRRCYKGTVFMDTITILEEVE